MTTTTWRQMKTEADIHVHQGDTLDMQYFDAPVAVRRRDDGDGEWVEIEFANGGQMAVFTTRPVVFVEPARQ
jgi:hypothetical protein